MRGAPVLVSRMPAMLYLHRTLATWWWCHERGLIVFSFVISDSAGTQMTAARLRCRARPRT
ncbi:hypothetical protein [Actinomyces sp. 432]|uniref:hypothetical protein n=1 Tax=Actinomyces sp. 432 TaxID=2057798 RepID=UPI00137B4031|nr:hypothetical protein [Actinomyces sp. 432]